MVYAESESLDESDSPLHYSIAVRIDGCTDVKCPDGKICHDLADSFVCKCPLDWSDDNCTALIDHCEESSCLNGGTCVSHDDGYSCHCPRGFAGRNCQAVPNSFSSQARFPGMPSVPSSVHFMSNKRPAFPSNMNIPNIPLTVTSDTEPLGAKPISNYVPSTNSNSDRSLITGPISSPVVGLRIPPKPGVHQNVQPYWQKFLKTN
ncbi:Neurogenic locus Notch protein [Halotydeus destructor]|nr:Neurogenic locus Notch protein [Halotydeus destructor]